MIPISHIHEVEQPRMASSDGARARLCCLRRASVIEQRRKYCIMICGGHFLDLD